MVRWADLDYAVLYVHDWQRQLLSAEVAAYFAELEPEKSIWIDGLEFARIYNLREAYPPDFLTVGIPGRAQWDNKIRLLSSDLVEQTVAPGATVDLTFYLQNIGSMDRNLNLRVRIVDQAGHELGRYDGWPYGSATSNWPLYEVWPDGHRFTAPVDATPGEYRAELAFYDPGSLERLPASGRGSLSDTIIAGYLRVDGVSPAETSDATIVEWEGLLGLTGGEVNGQNVPGRVQAAPGSTLQITLHWQAMRQSDHAYTYFLHLVDGEGRIVAQEDRQPLNGFIPTDRWLPGDRFVEEVTLDLPPEQDPAPYTLLMGIYDPESGRRLLAETGDSVPLAIINGDGSDQ